ncbi:uncharacterized protein MONBRDRAFT_32564 [Monosiga brevicollis MX1]|uniref:non-specific serine/threonine protein kinase n=1 Tax=Monosiga brevicollis TaxID=81824 RepID=A9V0C3_MONBE|nr:uncharacterized protein MONBRDRAFT_32564 [Monosiga brevicollis MX1]EDQ88985.1 predicted protein [Monosiga brevicollis MX1]|eukprot:XP_001746090.1 hypothetical protein [Monosiga brevicollis MX1]
MPIMPRAEHGTRIEGSGSERRYARTKVLGRGAFGTVFLVEDTETREKAVMKKVILTGLSRKELADTTNEAQIMSRLSHKNIIAFFDSFVEGDALCIIMEYAGGGDLDQVIRNSKRDGTYLEELRIWHYLIDIAQGLAYLHDQRVLHRDIKPSNVLLDHQGMCKIADLGFSRHLRAYEQQARSTVGTPLFSAPELCQDLPYGEKADCWALGCLLYELTALTTPFQATNAVALAGKIVKATPDPLPKQYSVELAFLCDRLLEKSPERRPSAWQVLQYPATSIRAEHRQLQQQLAARPSTPPPPHNQHDDSEALRAIIREQSQLIRDLQQDLAHADLARARLQTELQLAHQRPPASHSRLTPTSAPALPVSRSSPPIIAGPEPEGADSKHFAMDWEPHLLSPKPTRGISHSPQEAVTDSGPSTDAVFVSTPARRVVAPSTSNSDYTDPMQRHSELRQRLLGSFDERVVQRGADNRALGSPICTQPSKTGALARLHERQRGLDTVSASEPLVLPPWDVSPQPDRAPTHGPCDALHDISNVGAITDLDHRPPVCLDAVTEHLEMEHERAIANIRAELPLTGSAHLPQVRVGTGSSPARRHTADLTMADLEVGSDKLRRGQPSRTRSLEIQSHAKLAGWPDGASDSLEESAIAEHSDGELSLLELVRSLGEV